MTCTVVCVWVTPRKTRAIACIATTCTVAFCALVRAMLRDNLSDTCHGVRYDAVGTHQLEPLDDTLRREARRGSQTTFLSCVVYVSSVCM